jgi:hypothetical protein
MLKEKAKCLLKISALTFIFVFAYNYSSAQDSCGSDEIFQEMMKNDPVFRKKQELIKQRSSSRSQVQGLITIPVVVHVVYNNSEENVSDEQIYSQLQVLNEDFNSVITAPAQWSDVAANPQMEFCLATRDMYGNATCGITRTYTDSTEFVIQTSVKDESTGGISGWPAREYMNIFVCDIRNVRGYATFPDAEDSIDGIVIDYLSFGRGAEFNFSDPTRYHLGRTGTHEVGHWLRLSHIWGDGGCDIDDGIGDTPSSPGPNYGCAINSPACRGDSVNMVQNYMDYSDDACMNLFTQGQVNLMRKAFDERGSRVSILSSKGCDAPAQNEINFTINFDQFPEDISWELRNSSNMLVGSDGNFEPGDYINLVPAPLAYKSKTYTYDLPDGTYTLKFIDSFGDGFPQGSYEVKSIFDGIVISGPGTFTDMLSVSFTVDNAKYRFEGSVNNDWYNPANWNRFSPPSACYDDDIIIESMKECIVDELTLSQQKNLILRTNAKLTIR